jgi:pimeloyl-ACP methyl ester carboxylesterase
MRLTALLFTLTTAWSASSFADLPGKKSFDSNGVEIKYFDVGDGEPILLIHGFAASAVTNWGRVIPRLARDYRVIAMDNRGHGGSGKPVGEEYYGDEMIQDAVRLLDHLGIEKAHVVGYSMGGYITAKMATMYPERMRSATIGGAGWAKTAGVREQTLDELADALDKEGTYRPLMGRLNQTDSKMRELEIRVVDTFMQMSNDEAALASVARGMKQHTVTENEIKAIEIPVQLVCGADDPLIKAADNWCAVRPDHTLVTIHGGTHASTIGKKSFVQAIKSFIDDVN